MEQNDALVVGANEEDVDGTPFQILWVVPDLKEYKTFLREHGALEQVKTLVAGTIENLQTTLDYLQEA